jgi:hypothetical protein
MGHEVWEVVRKKWMESMAAVGVRGKHEASHIARHRPSTPLT